MDAPLPPASVDDHWIEIDSFTSIGDPADPPTDRTVEVQALVDGDEVDVYMHDLMADDLEDVGAPIHTLLQTTDRHDRYAVRAFAVVDDEVVFLGQCGQRTTDALARVASGLGRDDVDLMTEYVERGPDSELSRELD